MAERKLKALLDAAVGASAVGLLGAVKRFDRKRTADFAGAAMRKIGPLFKEHRLARQNLRAAFPEKSAAEIEQILAGVWDNLGRIAVEFAHLDEFCFEGVGRQTPDVITYAPEAAERYERIVASGKPMLGIRCSRNTASPAKTCAPPFRKNPPPRSSKSSPASGTISGGSRSSSPTSMNSASRASAGKRRTVITYAPEATERYRRMLDRGKPMLGFAAHLANWELPAVVAKVLVERSAVLYRRPNIRPSATSSSSCVSR